MKKIFLTLCFVLLTAGFASADEDCSQTIFYVNDIHAQLSKEEQIINAVVRFDNFAEKSDSDTLKLSAGDNFIGSDKNINKAAAAFIDAAGFDATVPGNHEFDMSASEYAKLIKNSNVRIIATNMNVPRKHPLFKQIVKSLVIEGKSGHKYGIVAALSPTLVERMKNPKLFEGIVIPGGDQRVRMLNSEIDKLKKLGINKIIMLSHSGNEEEKQLAVTVSGIDVIIGGHSHDLIKGVTEGENLLYSPAGEPVIITQAGRDGKYFGVLDLEYDDDGVIKSVRNSVYSTELFAKNSIMTSIADTLLGKSPIIAKLVYADPLTEKMNIEENPYVSYFADILRHETGAQIVLINSANFRGSLAPGVVTERDISGLFPFKNKLRMVSISEKALVDALNFGGASVTRADFKPSIIQVSGMTYTLDKSGRLIKASYLDNFGKMQKINVKNPSSDKMFNVVYDDYLLAGGDGFVMLKSDKILQEYDYDKDMSSIIYLRRFPSDNPLVIKRDNRIKVEKR